MRFFVFLFILIYGFSVRASCPLADQVARSQSLSQAIPLYINCALNENDDDSQLYLGKIYANGQGDVAKNTQRALLFYHLSTENGNASAMVSLSQLLTALDNSNATRWEIIKYLYYLQKNLQGQNRTSFQGQLLHPYAFLVLAAEKPESKWFYLSKIKTDPSAARVMKAYQIDPETRKKATKQATQWKQRKMLDMARDIFTVQEYNNFYQTLYPKSGIVDNFARSQAVQKLKEKVEKKLK